MKYEKFTKYEKKENRRANIAAAMSGKGLYLYENSSKHAELTLPRATHSGVRKVQPGKQFQGDDYYMQLVRTGELRFIACLDDGKPKEEVKPMNENTLILDQPATVTTKGTVENVVRKPAAKKKGLKEQQTPVNEQQEPVLLIEAPVGSITPVE